MGTRKQSLRSLRMQGENGSTLQSQASQVGPNSVKETEKQTAYDPNKPPSSRLFDSDT